MICVGMFLDITHVPTEKETNELEGDGLHAEYQN
jgi:hypothetical protein